MYQSVSDTVATLSNQRIWVKFAVSHMVICRVLSVLVNE